MRAGIYCRVSTDEQAKFGISLDCQQEELTKYATSMGYSIVDYYVDDGYTGTNLKRPGLQRLLRDAQNKKMDIVLVTKLDRWCRGVKNYYKLDDILSPNKVDWKTILEKYDTTTSIGRLQINIMLSIGENESATTSDRIKFVFRNKLEKKEPVSYSSLPLGYKVKDKHYVIDDNEAIVVKDVFRTMTFLQSARATRKTINQRYGLNLSDPQILGILRRKLYIGTYVSKKKDIIIEDFCEPIIDVSLFNEVQQLIGTNVRNRESATHEVVSHDYIFSGLIRCKRCGCILRSRVTPYTNKLGKQYKYSYRCQTSSKGRVCTNTTQIGEKKLELELVSTLCKRLSDLRDEYESKMILVSGERQIEQRYIKKVNKDKIKEQIEKLLSLYLDGEIDKDIYKEKYSSLLEKLVEADKLEKEQNEIISSDRDYSKDIETINDILSQPIIERYLMMDKLERRRFWKNIVKEIIYDKDEKLEVIFNM